jgi:hypothetical protein
VIFRARSDYDAVTCNRMASQMVSRLNDIDEPHFIERYLVAAATTIPQLSTNAPDAPKPIPVDQLTTGTYRAQRLNNHGSNHLPGIITMITIGALVVNILDIIICTHLIS